MCDPSPRRHAPTRGRPRLPWAARRPPRFPVFPPGCPSPGARPALRKREGRMSQPSRAPTETPRAAPAQEPARPAAHRPGFGGYTTPTFRATPAGRFLRRLLRACASLQLAIGLLSLFALCLAVATLLESAYGGAVAGELVYHAWWFSLLLS